MSKKKSHYNLYLVLLYIGSFLTSILPLFIYFFANKEKYVSSVPEAIKLSVGGILLMFFVALKVMGKLKMPSRLVFFGIVLIMSYLFATILEDLLIISLIAFLSEVVDYFIFQWAIKWMKENRIAEKNAKFTTAQIKKEFIGRT